MTFQEQLKSAKRELEMRQRCYPGWVRMDRLTQSEADHEIECMSAIVDTLRPLALEEQKEQPQEGQLDLM